MFSKSALPSRGSGSATCFLLGTSATRFVLQTKQDLAALLDRGGHTVAQLGQRHVHPDC